MSLDWSRALAISAASLWLIGFLIGLRHPFESYVPFVLLGIGLALFLAAVFFGPQVRQ